MSYAFTYHRSVEPQQNQQLRPLRLMRQYCLSGQAHLDSALLDRIEQGYGQGDDLCDAWVAVAQQLPAHGMRMFQQALDQGIDQVTDAPAELKALFAQLEQTPTWLKPELLNQGTATLARYPILQSLMLQSVSLMGGYAVPALAQPLLETGALAYSVLPRMARTLLFAAAVTAPYGMQMRQAGFKQAAHVRVIHALVRHKLRHSDTWPTATYGVPINQSDLIATNLQFSLVVLYGLRVFGSQLSADERYAVLHLWRYIGYVMGLNVEQMPTSEHECNQWLYAYLSTQKMDSQKAKPLAQALDQLPFLLADDNAVGRQSAYLEQQLRAGITRLFMGNTLADGLGLAKPRWLSPFLLGTAGSQFVLDRLRHIQPLGQLLEQGSFRYRNLIKAKYIRAEPSLAKPFAELESALLALSAEQSSQAA